MQVPSVSRLHRDAPAAIAVTKKGGRPAFETIPQQLFALSRTLECLRPKLCSVRAGSCTKSKPAGGTRASKWS